MKKSTPETLCFDFQSEPLCINPKRHASQDWTGRRFGMWTVLALHSRTVRGCKKWLCQCDCGKVKPVHSTSLPNGASRSCGCDRDVKTIIRSTKHGAASRLNKSPEYSSWREMMDRCFNLNEPCYEHYGGRGITVCERWRIAANFLADMPPRPMHHSIGRIDNNGNYEPGNVRWETDLQQARNKSTNRVIEFQGVTMCMSAWAERYGINQNMLRRRLKRGWPIETALTSPTGTKLCDC